MPAETIWVILAIFGFFGAFAVAVGYVSAIANGKAITAEEEMAARKA